jgi:hypothetical protein
VSFLAIFFIVFFLMAVVLGPIFGGESRQAVLRPDKKPRPNVGPPWHDDNW